MSKIPGFSDTQLGRLSAGRQLAAAREAQGLTVEEVVRHTKLSTRQVLALEADAYDQLPGPVFVRGFIRNYARHLQLDPVPLLAWIDSPTRLAAAAMQTAPAAPVAAAKSVESTTVSAEPVAMTEPAIVEAITAEVRDEDRLGEPTIVGDMADASNDSAGHPEATRADREAEPAVEVRTAWRNYALASLAVVIALIALVLFTQ